MDVHFIKKVTLLLDDSLVSTCTGIMLRAVMQHANKRLGYGMDELCAHMTNKEEVGKGTKVKQ